MILLLFLPMLLTYASTVPSPPTAVTDFSLRAVHVVFRHGDSELAIPSSASTDVPHDFNPYVHSDLTNAGKMRSYKFGQFLRSRYSDFLGEEYHRNDVYARSTYVERSRASLLLVLAGLYPPASKQRWHPTLNWQPISINSATHESDPLMWPISCPMYLEERKRIESTQGFLNSMESLVDFFVSLSNYTNTEREFTDKQLANLYRKLRIIVEDDDPMSDWDTFYQSIPSKIIRNAAILRYHTQNYNSRLRRLNGGMLLRKIFNDMVNFGMGEKMPKINLYAGQEFNVVAILWALNAWKPIVPTYSSAAIVEFWENNKGYYVKVLYHDGLTGDTATREIQGCGSTMCPFQKFVTLRSEEMPYDGSECFNNCQDGQECYENDVEIDDDFDRYSQSLQYEITDEDEENLRLKETTFYIEIPGDEETEQETNSVVREMRM